LQPPLIVFPSDKILLSNESSFLALNRKSFATRDIIFGRRVIPDSWYSTFRIARHLIPPICKWGYIRFINNILYYLIIVLKPYVAVILLHYSLTFDKLYRPDCNSTQGTFQSANILLNLVLSDQKIFTLTNKTKNSTRWSSSVTFSYLLRGE
jgi:hypothetical protein